MRGIDWIAVPSTLVGQVDAAIGGKTGIDLAEGKNLVGAFHWPVLTRIDTALLETLPDEERLNGLAEVVKTGLLAGEPYWELETEAQVRACAAYKAAVCLRDPREQGERVHLNLGHTFGHALETASGNTIPHGRAVALGLLGALRLSGLEEQARTSRRSWRRSRSRSIAMSPGRCSSGTRRRARDAYALSCSTLPEPRASPRTSSLSVCERPSTRSSRRVTPCGSSS
jgi:3-dehydroquinate synthetase